MNQKKTLHILKDKTNLSPLDFIKHIEQSQKIAIVLIQDAVEMDVSALKTAPLVLLEDLAPSANSAHKKISYDDLLSLIFEYDAVLSW